MHLISVSLHISDLRRKQRLFCWCVGVHMPPPCVYRVPLPYNTCHRFFKGRLHSKALFLERFFEDVPGNV